MSPLTPDVPDLRNRTEPAGRDDREAVAKAVAEAEHITADELLAAVRNHWQIENSVFFLKDRWWDEDRHWTRRPGLSEWLARLTTAATTVLRIFRNTPIPLRGFADFIQWNPRLGLEILGLA